MQRDKEKKKPGKTKRMLQEKPIVKSQGSEIEKEVEQKTIYASETHENRSINR